jgi:hypothetical protein
VVTVPWSEPNGIIFPFAKLCNISPTGDTTQNHFSVRIDENLYPSAKRENKAFRKTSDVQKGPQTAPTAMPSCQSQKVTFRVFRYTNFIGRWTSAANGARKYNFAQDWPRVGSKRRNTPPRNKILPLAKKTKLCSDWPI